jgi:hypothetical protein
VPIEANEVDEKELSLKIRDYLNKSSMFEFKFIDDFCDIADIKNKVYIEVKTDHFAHSQILHAVAKNGIKDAEYLGVANRNAVKLYRPPDFGKILSFATGFDPKLVFTPSQVDKPELNAQAEAILGEPEKVIRLEFEVSPYLFITKDNMRDVRVMTDRYRIGLDLLVNWLDGVGENNSIKVNKDGWLVNTERPDMFTNESADEKRAKELAEFGGYRRPKHTPIRANDVPYFESLRIKHEDLADVLHEVDRLLSRKKRRERGVFWTESEIGDKLADEILKLTQPDYVVEPCVGGGSLIKNIVPKYKGAMNDISAGHVEGCKKIFDGYDWKFTVYDVVNAPIDVLLREWQVPAGKTLLLYTNPPFGTSSSNRLVSKKGELSDRLSRQQSITYSHGLEKYGKGDLFLPIVGKLIEIAKVKKNCYLAFFAPFGLFCGRKRYMKLFSALMKDFHFLKGYVFAGGNFHDINQTLGISLSIWKYSPNICSKHLNLRFEFLNKNGESKELEFKRAHLLKDNWRYRDGNKYVKNKVRGAIGVTRCDTFNAPNAKVFGLDAKEGSGAELSPDNFKQRPIFTVPNVPTELVYGLWSVSIGCGAFGTSLSTPMFPIYMRDAYVHLPDFERKEVIEILAYSALHALFKNYAADKIGFFGSNRVFKFGDERLTKGVEYIFNVCKDCIVYDNFTITDIFEQIRQSNFDKEKCRRGIKEEVAKRLVQIGYWDHVPIPADTDTTTAEEEGMSKL